MKLLFTFLFSISINISVYAQKLPDIQSSSVIAPTIVKIDGKNLEWNGFLAENKRTGLFYTISNDDRNLYLAFKANADEIINKIFAGGVSFSINTKGKKNENEASTITYPLVVRSTVRGVGGPGMPNRQRMGQNRSEQSKQQRDSVTLEQRRTLLAGIKEIKVKGFNIPDSVISIYNEYGIKAIAKMDEQKSYFCEIAIPLSTLGLSINDNREIAYQIKLNGRQGGGFPVRASVRNEGLGGAGNNRGGFGANNSGQQDLMAATDFWAKYIILK